MQDKIMFREMLSEIKEHADKRGNRLSVRDVKEFFENAHLEEEQFKLIYEYLISQKIKIDGYKPEKQQVSESGRTEKSKEKTPQAAESDMFTAMYLEDLKAVSPVSESEEQVLFEKAAGGDDLAKSKLVTLYLRTVYELSQSFRDGELPQSDLIQEGNIGLMLALNELPPQDGIAEYRNYLYEQVKHSMEEALEEQRDIRDMDQGIAERTNYLQEAVRNLEAELEHKVSLDELSAYLEMPLEEIKDILRIAGDEIEVAGGHYHSAPE